MRRRTKQDSVGSKKASFLGQEQPLNRDNQKGLLMQEKRVASSVIYSLRLLAVHPRTWAAECAEKCKALNKFLVKSNAGDAHGS